MAAGSSLDYAREQGRQGQGSSSSSGSSSTGKDKMGNGDSQHGKRRIALVLLRNDLRIHDNPSLYYAQHHESKPTHILPIYVFDEAQIECSGLPEYKRKGPEAKTRLCKFWRTGVFRARLVTEAVYDVRHRLRERGSDLLIRFGIPHEVLSNVIAALHARGDEIVALEMQKEICSEELAVEKSIFRAFRKASLDTHIIRFHDSKPMIHRDDLPFAVHETPDVFTPFRKKVENLDKKMVRPMLEMPDTFLPYPEDAEHRIEDDQNYGRSLESEGVENILAYFLEPLKGSYEMKYADPKLSKHRSSAFPWSGGESSALERLEWYFVTGSPPPLAKYKETRNMLLGHAYSTKMSPFLCIGCISPRMIHKAIEDHEERYGSNQNTYWVRFEMLWRDYFMYVSEKFGNHLFRIEGFEQVTDPKMADKKKDEWNDWSPDNYLVKAWMRGRTGVPFIDANIIELRETGFMSNRGRQNVASFLTKDLYFDWRIGAEFFESHLIDYEPTANWGNWQYVAGVGNDPRASRQFNPIKQARDYDPTGAYVRAWIVQLKDVPSSKVHTPWLMSDDEWSRYIPDSTLVADLTVGNKSAKPTVVSGTRYKLDQDTANAIGIAGTAKANGSRRKESKPGAFQDMGSLGNALKAIPSASYTTATSSSGSSTNRSGRTGSRSSGSQGEGSANGSNSSGLKAQRGGLSASGSSWTAGSSSTGNTTASSAYDSSTSSRSGSYSDDAEADDDSGGGGPESGGSVSGSGDGSTAALDSQPPFFSPPSAAGGNKTSSFRASPPSASHGQEKNPKSQGNGLSPSEAISKEAHAVRNDDFEQHLRSEPEKAQSATQLTQGMDSRNDYLSSTPYPRKPLFEQPSWKPHYFRKDYGRRKNGPGGGNSRRLLRAPPEGWQPKA